MEEGERGDREQGKIQAQKEKDAKIDMLNEGEHANKRDFGSYPLPYSVERHRLSAKTFFLIKGLWSSVHA